MKICVIVPHVKCELSDSYKRVHIEELKGVEDSSCLEVYLGNVPDYIQLPQREELYQLSIKKLRHGGILCVAGHDLYDICKDMTFNELGVGDVNNLLFDRCLSMDSLLNVRDTLKTMGLKIKEYYYDGPHAYVIKGIRE